MLHLLHPSILHLLSSVYFGHQSPERQHGSTPSLNHFAGSASSFITRARSCWWLNYLAAPVPYIRIGGNLFGTGELRERRKIESLNDVENGGVGVGVGVGVEGGIEHVHLWERGR